MLVEIKTKPTAENVVAFIQKISDAQKRQDAFTLLEWMQKASGKTPTMWGPTMIGFGKVVVKSKLTEREVECFQAGFSPRKTTFSIYLTCDIQEHAAALKKLGKHKTGVGCLYINKLADVDTTVLQAMINKAFKS